VRGERTPPAPRRQHFRDTVNPRSSCTVRAVRGRGDSPLTPCPSPQSGEKGARCRIRQKVNAIGLAPSIPPKTASKIFITLRHRRWRRQSVRLSVARRRRRRRSPAYSVRVASFHQCVRRPAGHQIGVLELDQYIEQQAAHHQGHSFKDELRELFRRYGVAWDEKYVWN
jgi:hypothetical protein